MKNQYNHFISLLTLLIGLSDLQAQEMKTVLEINSSIINTPCNLDSAQRSCLLAKKRKNTSDKSISFSGKGCQFTTSQNLSIGNYVMTVSSFGFED